MDSKAYFSPSQFKTAARCMRKWNGENVQGWRQGDTPSTTLGKNVHAVMEKYLTTGVVPRIEDGEAEAIFIPALRFLPEYGTPHLLTEQEVFIPKEEFNTGKDLKGFLDVTVLHHVDPDGTVWLLVYDGKTTSNLKYAKSEEELENDPQCLIYCWAARQLSIGAVGYDHQNIRFAHVYMRTRGGPASMLSYVDLTPERISAGLQKLSLLANKMLQWDQVPFADVPPNLDACGDFGGCHLKPECAQTGLLVYGESPEAIITSQLKHTRLTKEQGVNMGLGALSRNKSMAAMAFASVLRPAPDAAPFAGINPPDGDAKGESGMLQDPGLPPPETDEEALGVTVSEEEEEAAELPVEYAAELPVEYAAELPVEEAPAEPTPEPASEPPEQLKEETPAPSLLGLLGLAAKDQVATKNPDSGYVPVEQPVAIPGQASVTSGRPAAKPALWDRVEVLVQGLQKDTEAWNRATAISHDVVSRLLSGQLKLRTGTVKIPELEEVIKILEACTAADMARLVKAPAPAAEPVVDSVQDTAKRLEQAKVALVTAKDQLAVNLKELRELDQKQQDSGSDEDADAYTKYNTEVYIPSRKRVQAGEVSVKEWETKLAQVTEEKARKDEEARVAQERAAAEKLVQQTAQKEVAVVEQKVEGTASLPEGGIRFRQQKVDGKSSGCWVIHGIPTRLNKGNYLHIDELINPYRVAVETAAMNSLYTAITPEWTGHNRICQHIILALTNGTLVLPRFLCVPSHMNILQDRVLDALNPYLEDYFAKI